MDEIVRKAMAKWPNVPDCFGWLGLDRRGQWHMRDERAQALGSFQSGVVGARGTVLRHDKLIEFIHRNYEADAQGRWYFQNGPQRVYVELEAAPWVWRVSPQGELVSHTGLPTQAQQCLCDQWGHVYVATPLGLGLVHTQDVGHVAQLIEQGHWALADCQREQLPQQYGFVLSPQQA